MYINYHQLTLCPMDPGLKDVEQKTPERPSKAPLSSEPTRGFFSREKW